MKANRVKCSECALHPLCLPASVSIEEIERLEEIVLQRRPMQRGDRLFNAGENQRAVYVASQGSFKTSVVNEGGEEQTIAFYMPGELIGLDGLSAGAHRCDAVALEPSLVCEVPMASLERLSQKIPGLQWQLLRNIGKSMEQDQDHLTMMGRKQAQDRLAMFLHGLSERQRALGRPSDVLLLSMGRADIASYLGLVIETVSRGLSQMQDQGLIQVQGREIRILKPDTIAAMSHGDYEPTPIRKHA
ncbi:Crp/Fnr family transcriptional regulator [Ahniella affigens]|uniref:CRP-like protein Clp n=1 Tax=Ahniella affigens TaxID=2021234 RepID=A0A2P1PN62_9GAMM|nr:helix-turn-helix domain-containing protein [Ahniella affigens]AVP96294.1 Crp/Fnr family transcriptional regulator [Ahniella affigens]